jgi:DNA-binding NarL/FixJ family response regulator
LGVKGPGVDGEGGGLGKRAGGWKVVIVDSDRDRRQKLADDCGEIPEIESVSLALSPQEAADRLGSERPDVVIVDLEVAPLGQMSEFGRLCRGVGASVILVTAGQDPSVLAEVMDWASGFLPRSASPTNVGHAVRVVRTGAFYMESDQARGMVEELDALREVADRAPSGESLTPREKEVLRLLSEGLSARQMARRLELSERTINTHVANVYRKLAVSNRVQAVRQAIRLGLVNEPK